MTDSQCVQCRLHSICNLLPELVRAVQDELDTLEAAPGGGVVEGGGEELVPGVHPLSAHRLDEHAADLDGVGAGAVGVVADLDEAVVQREAPPHVHRKHVGAVPEEGDLQVEALVGAVGGAVDRDSRTLKILPKDQFDFYRFLFIVIFDCLTEKSGSRCNFVQYFCDASIEWRPC